MFNCFTSHLTAGLRVCVHSWAEGGGGAGELGVGSLGQAGIVFTGVARHSVLVVVRLVVRLGVIGRRLVVGGCWRMVGWLWGIWSRSRMVGGLWDISRDRSRSRVIGWLWDISRDWSWSRVIGGFWDIWSRSRAIGWLRDISRDWSRSGVGGCWFMIYWRRGVRCWRVCWWRHWRVLSLRSGLLTDSLDWEAVEGGEVLLAVGFSSHDGQEGEGGQW